MAVKETTVRDRRHEPGFKCKIRCYGYYPKDDHFVYESYIPDHFIFQHWKRKRKPLAAQYRY